RPACERLLRYGMYRPGGLPDFPILLAVQEVPAAGKIARLAWRGNGSDRQDGGNRVLARRPRRRGQRPTAAPRLRGHLPGPSRCVGGLLDRDGVAVGDTVDLAVVGGDGHLDLVPLLDRDAGERGQVERVALAGGARGRLDGGAVDRPD